MPGSAPTSSIGGSRGTSRACPTTTARRCASARASSPEARDEPADAREISPVIVTEDVGEVALFVADRDQHVDLRSSGEQQMPDSHFRRRPEGKEEAGIKRVRDASMEERLA